MAVVAFARTAAAAEVLGGDPTVRMTQTLARTNDGVNQAVALALAGQRQRAQSASLDAYLAFEPLETPLAARDARAVTAVEQAFRDFRATLASGDTAQVHAAHQAVDASLAAARRTLTAQSSTSMLFSQSLIIMLREGLEAILLVGALMAFTVKAGVPERKREMLWGVLAAVGASLATAGILATLFHESAAHREALEGIVMMVAAGVLFSVSYWLISKIEAKKWQAFVGGKIKQALSSGGTLALAAVAFLAVYREGFETVLFYAALFSTGKGPGSTAAIAAGILLGFGLLCVVYYGIQRWGLRLPLKPFFGVTSALLYLMAFSFAGQGIADLQEAGLVPATHIRWVPSVPALGIFPTTQTVAIQSVLALAVVAALVWVFWLEPQAAGEGGRGKREG
jgi:high-affinity iron transporter